MRGKGKTVVKRVYAADKYIFKMMLNAYRKKVNAKGTEADMFREIAKTWKSRHDREQYQNLYTVKKVHH